MVSASTRLPASVRAATPPGVCNSSSSSSIPIWRSCSASCVRDSVVEFVTNRSRWPCSRRPRTAAGAPEIGVPETCRTPSTSSRIAAMDVESIRSEIAFRFSRSSGPGGQHAQKTSTRAEGLFDVAESRGPERARAAARAREARPRRPSGGAGRALAAPQPGARRRPNRRAAARSAGRPPQAPGDSPDKSLPRTPPGRETPPGRNEATARPGRRFVTRV